MGGGYRTLIGPAELQSGVTRLAGEISAAYDDGVVLVAVLKGSVPFLADLVRSLTVVPVIEFMAISSYAPNTGRVRIVMDTEVDLYGRQVVLIEDIVDTGLTLTYLLNELRGREAASVDACALLDKSVRRIVPTPLRFRGFEIGDEFVLGYGLDYAERYRNLDRIVAADLGLLRSDPDSYVDTFYPSGTSPSGTSVSESRD
ncbi:MAG: hypoxanthine phosphoribosyltransferase [Acidimicrobiales bacterium]